MYTKDGDSFREPEMRVMGATRAGFGRTLHGCTSLTELLGYAAVSAAALALDICILKLLVTISGWHYIPASAVSFIAGAALAYALSVRYVFSVRASSNRAWELVVTHCNLLGFLDPNDS